MEVLSHPITDLQQTERLAMAGVHHPIPTLIMGSVYEIITIIFQSRDIFAIVKINYQEKFIIIKLPQRCHESFEKFYKTVTEFHAPSLYLLYRGTNDDGEHVLLFNGGGFVSDLY